MTKDTHASTLQENTKQFWTLSGLLLIIVVVILGVYGFLLNSEMVSFALQQSFVWFVFSFVLLYVSILAFVFGKKGMLHDSKYARVVQIPHGWRTLLAVIVKEKVKGKEEPRIVTGIGQYAYGVFFLIAAFYFWRLGIATMRTFSVPLKSTDTILVNRGLHLYPSLLIVPMILILVVVVWLGYKSLKELTFPTSLKLLVYDLFWLIVIGISAFMILLFGLMTLGYITDSLQGSVVSNSERVIQKIIVDDESDVYVEEPESFSTVSSLSRMKSKHYIVVFENGSERKAFPVEEELYEIIDEGDSFTITYFPMTEELVALE